jgi:hypothetical protein
MPGVASVHGERASESDKSNSVRHESRGLEKPALLRSHIEDVEWGVTPLDGCGSTPVDESI